MVILDKILLNFEVNRTSAKCIFVLLFIFAPNTNLLAQAHFSYDQSEIVLETEIQYDWIDEDCDPIDCEEKDGLRVADVLFRYNYFTSINSLVFVEVSIDLADDVSNDMFSNSFRTNDKYPDSDTIDTAFVGSQIDKVEISIGKRIPISTGFSPTNSSYLGLNLSAFDDDRYLVSSGKADNIIYRVDWSDRYRYAISTGIAENNNLIPDLNYEMLFDGPLFESRGVHFSTAIKSVDINGADGFKASGIKLSWFQNNGSLFEVAFSKNDFGEYSEFLFRRDCNSRHSFELGVSNFDVDQSDNLQGIGVASNSEFAYINYTFSISRTLRWFIERSEFDSDSFNSNVLLSGLEFSF